MDGRQYDSGQTGESLYPIKQIIYVTHFIKVAGGNGAGTAANQTFSPWGIHVDTNGTIFVVEYSAHRVSKWLKSNRCSYRGQTFQHVCFVDATVGITVAGQAGVPGPWAYLFSNPTSLAFDQYGYMYVLDTGNKRIQRWWPGASYGITVASSTTLSSPYGLSIGIAGNIVVADTSNHRVISFAAVCRKYFSNFSRDLLLRNFITQNSVRSTINRERHLTSHARVGWVDDI